MAVVFADSGYFIANLNERDPLHERVAAVTEGIVPLQIVTTQMVLTEVLNYMSDGGEYLRILAVQLVQGLNDNPDTEIIPQTDAQFKATVERYASRSDQRWSLTDCGASSSWKSVASPRRWPTTVTSSRQALLLF